MNYGFLGFVVSSGEKILIIVLRIDQNSISVKIVKTVKIIKASLQRRHSRSAFGRESISGKLPRHSRSVFGRESIVKPSGKKT